MCKNVLGVHKNAADLMAKAELGRYPLMSNIIKNIYSYWQHILQANESSLLHQTIKYLIKKDREGQTNYYSRIKALLVTLKSPSLIYKCEPSRSKEKANILKMMYHKEYEFFFFRTIKEKAERVDSGGRFELYHRVKKNYKFENYLNLEKNTLRRSVTNIRISTHCLPIESLRRHKVERKHRMCLLCDSNQIGSEEHTLMHCNNEDIAQLRTNLFQKLSECCKQWQNLPSNMKFIYLVSACDKDFSFYFSIFLEKIYKIVQNKG